MQKLLTTLPSTKPDLKHSSPSHSSTTMSFPPSSLKTKLIQLLKTMRSILKNRHSFFSRDIDEIYNKNDQLFNEWLCVEDSHSLWLLLIQNKYQNELQEQQQIYLLLQLLTQMHRAKLQAADDGRIKVFDELKNVINWFIEQIISYQADLRQTIQESIKTQQFQEGKKLEESFKQYQMRIISDFQKIQDVKRNNLIHKIEWERDFRQQAIEQEINNTAYKFKPSSLLTQAKNTALLQKLAPFAWEKKRINEDQQLEKNINWTIEMDRSRKLAMIENLKMVEKKKIRRQHQTILTTQQLRRQSERNEFTLQLKRQQQKYQSNQRNKNRSVLESTAKTTNQRLLFLKKSLQAFTQHGETSKISQIVQNHNLKAQFNPNIEESTDNNSFTKQLQSQYCTINTDRGTYRYEKRREKQEKRLQKRILEKINNSQAKDSQLSRKNSLVDLYDQSLNLIQ